MDNIQGNVSTVAVALYAILAPYISQYVSQEVFVAIAGLLLVLWSAYNPNTFKFLGNDKEEPVTLDDNDGVLNDEYVTGDDDGC